MVEVWYALPCKKLLSVIFPGEIHLPQDQEGLGPTETDKMNFSTNSQDPHLHSAFDSTAYCSSSGTH